MRTKLDIRSGGPAEFGEGVFLGTRTQSITATKIGGTTVVVVAGRKVFSVGMIRGLIIVSAIVLGLTVMSWFGVPLSLPSPWNWFMWGLVGLQVLVGLLIGSPGRFQLHSIEHKVCNAYRECMPATVESIKAADYFHPACGSIVSGNIIVLLLALWGSLDYCPLLLLAVVVVGGIVLAPLESWIPVLNRVIRVLQRIVCHEPTEEQYQLGVVLLEKLYELECQEASYSADMQQPDNAVQDVPVEDSLCR